MNPENSTSEEKTPRGVEHAGFIDRLNFEESSAEVLLVLVEKRPWGSDPAQLFQLQEKLNAYFSFILDGEMLEAYPQFAGKRVRVRLECVGLPGEEETRFLAHVHEQGALQGIAFEVDVGRPR